MADITTSSAKWQFDFRFKRGDEENSRVFSVDNPISSAAGVSAAKAFRDVFTGAASSPFSVIDPTQFIQPTGWRDENPNEAPWTTTAVYLKRIDTTEVIYDGGGPASRNITIEPNTSLGKINIYISDYNPAGSILVNQFVNGQWSAATVNKAGDGDYWRSDVSTTATKMSVYVPPNADTDVPPDFEIFNNPWSA